MKERKLVGIKGNNNPIETGKGAFAVVVVVVVVLAVVVVEVDIVVDYLSRSCRTELIAAAVVTSVFELSFYLTYYIQPLIPLYKLYQQVCKLSFMHNYFKFRIHLLSNQNALFLCS